MKRKNGRIVMQKPYSCPITRSLQTKFSTKQHYYQMCKMYQDRGVKLSNNIYFKLYEELCSCCKNKGNPRHVLHGASVMSSEKLNELIKQINEGKRR